MYIGENTPRIYSVPISITISKIFFTDFSLLNTVKENKNEDFKDNTDWKIFLRLGVEIRNSWEGIRFKNDDQNQEVIFIRNELYSTLKGIETFILLKNFILFLSSVKKICM